MIPFITAVGASFFLQYAVAGIFGSGYKSYPDVPGLDGSVAFLGFRVLRTQGLVIAVALVSLAALYLFVVRTDTGQRLLAVADNPELAEAYGIDTRRIYVVAMLLAGVLIVALRRNQVTPLLMFLKDRSQ
mgnify:CR=1 FL=1